jgi:hypothetical protein
MFDDDDDLEPSEFDDWFDVYFSLFPAELKDGFEPKPEIYDFYQGMYLRIMQDLTPAIRKLMYKQYPEIETERRPAVVKKIENILSATGPIFLIRLFVLLNDERNGVDLRAKHPEFDEWVKSYAHAKNPYEKSNKIFAKLPWLTEEQKKEIIEKTIEEDLFDINWKEMRKWDFIDTVQTIVLKHYRQVENLSADGWIVYSAFLTLEYAEYRFDIEFISAFITALLPEEDIHLKYSEIQKKVDAFFAEQYKFKNETSDQGGDGE